MLRRIYRTASLFCAFVYRRLPIFGALRGSIAIVQRNGRYLMIDRNDGLGLSFPGGLTHPWESAEQALEREILEETGMKITSLVFRFSYRDNSFYPNQTSVFEAQIDGVPRSSWEGDVVEVPAMEVHRRIMKSQRPVLQKLLPLGQLEVSSKT